MPVFVISTLKQKNGAQFPIVDDIDMKGGYRIVADIAARNSIFTSMRKHGMRVHVVSDNTDYRLGIGLQNTDWSPIADGGAFEKLGPPTTGDWTDSFLRLTDDTKKTDAIYLADRILGKLAPARPADLSSKTLSLPTYTALAASSGVSHVCTADTTPTAVVNDFGDGDDGTLIAYIDTVNSGSAVLSAADDSGNYNALNIISNDDPYVGQPGKEGIFKQLSASMTPMIPMSIGQHNYRLSHSITGDTPIITFYIDDPAVPNVSNVMISLPGGNTKFVSGVPTLSASDIMLFTFRINNAVKTHYNNTKLGVVSGANIINFNAATPISPPANGSSVDYLSKPTNPLGYAETISIIITPYNSSDSAGTPYNDTIQSRVDTVSDESSRVESGSGNFPTTSYGGVFNSNISLKVGYTEELQMLNGKYQIPTGNYLNNLPTPGENYDVGMGILDRWVTFKPVVLTNKSAFDIDILGAKNFSGIETSGIKIYAKVEGVTGWLNANVSYPGTGNPSLDNDPAMVFAQSNTTKKRVTFGSIVRTGQLIIRIGIPYNSNKKLSGINISNII